MIVALQFGAAEISKGRSVRPARFALRSSLPLSAASLVANGVREQLARLLGRDGEVELLEPIVPGSDERRVLVDGALVRRVRGRRGDAFVVLRPNDAALLAGLAFGEAERMPPAPLSSLERETLERFVAAFVPLCTSLCGTLGPSAAETSERAAAEIVTYFEVRTVSAPAIAVGFGLSADPPEERGAPLTLADLADVEVEGHVEFAAGSLPVPAFGRLSAGSLVPLETRLGAPATLCVGGIALARGTAGAKGGAWVFDSGASAP